jgi:hypothetical protein
MPGGVSGLADQGSIAQSNKGKPAPAGVLTANTVYVLAVEAGFSPSQAKTMVAIAFDESSFKQTAVSPANHNGTKDYGLFQINSSWFSDSTFKSKGWNATSLLEGHANAQAAKYVYDKQGFHAWSTYNHGLSAAAQGAAKTSDVAGAAPDMASGLSIPNPIKDVGNAIDSIGGTIMKVFANVEIAIFALVLLGVGVFILFRHQAAGVAKKVGKVAAIGAVV